VTLRSNSPAHAALLVASCLLFGHATAETPAVADLVDRADWSERAIIDSAALHADDVGATSYVRGVAARVCAEVAPTARVWLYAHDDAFTFALPNGAVFISIGMLGRVMSEAELAALLARECVAAGAVTVLDSRKWSGGFWIFAVSASKQPLLPTLWSPSTIRGVGAEKEESIDAEVISAMIKAGYNPYAASMIFDRLSRDAKRVHSSQPFQAANADAMQRRAASLHALASAHARTGDDLPAPLQRELRGVVSELYERYLTFGRQSDALELLSVDGRAEFWKGRGAYWLGEAYRRAGLTADLARAVDAYTRSLESAVPEPRALAALGRLRLKEGHRAEARRLLQSYLASVPNAPDAGLIERELHELGPEPQ